VPKWLLSDEDDLFRKPAKYVNYFPFIILSADIMGLLCDSVKSQIKHIVNHKVILLFSCGQV